VTVFSVFFLSDSSAQGAVLVFLVAFFFFCCSCFSFLGPVAPWLVVSFVPLVLETLINILLSQKKKKRIALIEN
jgi:hypothetical protein